MVLFLNKIAGMKKLSLIVLFCALCSKFVSAQELNCKVTVISPTIQMSNKQIFNSMQQSIWQFMNTKKWTPNQYEPQEKIECNLQIEITYASTDKFTAKAQLNVLRPVYGSAYKTIIFNQVDVEWAFNYVEFQSMEFQENASVSNLTSLLAFYAYIVLGVDYDTYALEGGTPYFTKAQNVANINANDPGWDANAGNSSLNNRYYLIENFMNARYKPLRQATYEYHRLGLDIMYKEPDKGREAITEAVKLIEPVAQLMPNTLIIKVFFNAKANELVELYKQAPSVDKNKMVTLLSKLDPANKSKYDKIKE